MTPTELLNNAPVHSIGDTALILGLKLKSGEPYRQAVRDLIRKGSIRIVDPDQPVTRWCVSSAEIQRYIDSGPRKGADVVPIRSAS